MSSRYRIDDRSLVPGTNAPPEKWLSFHVYLSGSIDLFLSRHLAPALERECASQHIRRFFFIRYLEQDLHLRLRFMLDKRGEPAVLKAWIESRIRDFTNSLPPASPSRVEQHIYDREQHYFGETIHSVYSELLNEKTSWLGLRLLRGYYDRRPYLMVLVVACLRFFLLGMTDGREEFIRAVEASCLFAGNVLTQLGLPPDDHPNEGQAAFDALILQVYGRFRPFLSEDATATVFIGLARRALKRGERGKSVVTHSLHLFCNKLGLSMQEEYWIFRSLMRITGDFDG